MKSVQSDVLFKTCVVSIIISHKLKGDVAISILEPSKVVMSFLYQPFDLTLKSTTIRNNLLLAICSMLGLRS